MIVIKTSGKTIENVVRHAKHALSCQPRLRRGDIILISQTKDSLPPYTKPIQYVMEFERCYYDREEESRQIWGEFWSYILECRNCRQLNKPFEISDVQVTEKDYGRGGPIVYVEEADIRALKEKGLLASQ
jgi:5-methylcytosine-specific restriction enzyme A